MIREGYTSGFEPTWSLEITDIEGDIDEATENEIARLVEEGYTSGEVVMYKYAKGGEIDGRYLVSLDGRNDLWRGNNYDEYSKEIQQGKSHLVQSLQ